MRHVDALSDLPGDALWHPLHERRFLVILGVSLFLHAIVFAWISAPRQPVDSPLPVLMASLRLMVPPVAAIPDSIAHSAAAPAPAVPKVRQPSPRVEHSVSPRVIEAAGPARMVPVPPAPPASSTMSAPPAEAPAVATGPVADSAPRLAGSAAAASTVDTPPVRPQGELLAGYRARLAELFSRHQDYPRIAAMRGWEGEVRVRLRVARKGNLVGVQIDRSSGYEVLDQDALAMLERLSALPPLPDGVDGNEIQVVVPVNYRLKRST